MKNKTLKGISEALPVFYLDLNIITTSSVKLQPEKYIILIMGVKQLELIEFVRY
jgi:hypothetical protein